MFLSASKKKTIRRQISAALAFALILSIILPVFGYSPAAAAKREKDRTKQTMPLYEQTIPVVLYTDWTYSALLIPETEEAQPLPAQKPEEKPAEAPADEPVQEPASDDPVPAEKEPLPVIEEPAQPDPEPVPEIEPIIIDDPVPAEETAEASFSLSSERLNLARGEEEEDSDDLEDLIRQMEALLHEDDEEDEDGGEETPADPGSIEDPEQQTAPDNAAVGGEEPEAEASDPDRNEPSEQNEQTPEIAREEIRYELTLTGEMPEGVTAKAYPIKTEILGMEAICGFNIRLFLPNGSRYKPENTLTVEILAPELADIVSGGVQLAAWGLKTLTGEAAEAKELRIDRETGKVLADIESLVFVMLTNVPKEEPNADDVVSDGEPELTLTYFTLRFAGASGDPKTPGCQDVTKTVAKGAPEGFEIVEAVRFKHAESYETVHLTLNTLPKTEEGKVYALYGLTGDDQLFDTAVRTGMQPGDEETLELAWYKGFALVLIDERVENTTKIIQYDKQTTVTLSGVMPVGGTVTLTPMRAAYREGTLFTFGVEITDTYGNAYLPSAESPIEMRISSDAISKALDNGMEILVETVQIKGGLKAVESDVGRSDELCFMMTGAGQYVVSQVEIQTAGGMTIWAIEELGVYLTGKLPTGGIVQAIPVNVEIDGQRTLTAYDIRIFANQNQFDRGRTWQPAKDKVQVHFYSENFTAGALSVYHLADPVSDAEFVTTATASENWVSFEAGSFSVYAVTTILEQTIEASDGSTYKITVTYDGETGIPANTALQVSEVTPDSADYAGYIEQSLDVLGMDSYSYAHAFDIRIVDALDPGVQYQPAAGTQVSVSIELLGAQDAFDDLGVVHFGASPEPVNATADGSSIRFLADSFSVYTVIGEVYLRTYRFFTFNEYGDYTEYAFYTDTGMTTFTQTIKNGEKPIAPQNPTNPQDPGATFAGWYEGHLEDTPGGQTSLVFAQDPYDFDNIPEITGNEEVRLYAKFSEYVYVIFHDQYDAQTGTFPVAFTRRVTLGEETTYIDISPYSVVYSGGNGMAFYGWSRTAITTPGASLDDEGSEVTKEADSLAVYGTTHLYPIFRSVYWLSFYSGPTGSGATYYPEKYYWDGLVPSDLSGRIPSRDGAYVFDGWYADASLDGSGEVVTGSAVKIANADGTLCSDASASGISVAYDFDLGHDVIRLTENVMLYAGWIGNTQANYTVVIQRQKATDEENLPPEEKTYEYAESFVLTGTIGDEIPRSAQYEVLDTAAGYNALHPNAGITDETNPYRGFVFNSDKSETSVTVTADGGAILNIYYDWTQRPDMTGRRFVLTFADSGSALLTSPSLPRVYTGTEKVEYGTALASLVPDDPVCEVPTAYTFTGWYADAGCTTRAFFEQDAEYTAYTGSKVLFETMPGGDLTVYAGWEVSWFVVTIDPNYGALYAYNDSHQLTGTGSTWFWSAYGGQIQEYSTVKRDYVESDSGTWYYVNHAGDGSGSSIWPDRYTYYTQDPGEATEFTTFEYSPGIYRYAGWYEQLPGGGEAPYDFSGIVDRNITLKLHWTKVGAFYLQYDAGAGKLNGGESLEALYVELENDNSYADNAEVVVTRSVTAPEGSEFIGWRIRGDDSGKLYYPGQTFILLTKYAATVQGRKTVYLEAVYTQVPTAKIVYDANGGVISGSVDYGAPVNANAPTPVTKHDDTTATISNLVNNSPIILSDGTGFSRLNASLAGWSNKPVYDPDDADAVLYPLGASENIYVDADEPFVLYAIWQVSVRYHLNEDPEHADFGGDWGADYTLDPEDLYTQSAYLGTAVSCPPLVPQYGGGTQMFRYWATKDENNEYVQYDFSQPVTDELDLYAYWSGPILVPVGAADASAQTIADKTAAWGALELSLGSSAYALDESAAAELVPGIPADLNYEFAFAAVGAADDCTSITENDAVSSVWYNASAGKVYVTYESGSSAALGEDNAVWFVCFAQKVLQIGYKAAGTDDSLSDAAASADAPTETGLLGAYDMQQSLTQPLSYVSGYPYYSFAVGTESGGNTELMLVTDAYDTSDPRPALKVKNTWRGFEVSTDNGSTWTGCGYDPQLYVVYYPEQPELVTISAETVGLAEDMLASFTYTIAVTQMQGGSEMTILSGTYSLTGGESHVVTLFHSADAPQTIRVTQAASDTFETTIEDESGLGTADEANRTWSYTTTGVASCGVTFVNTRAFVPVEVHAALVDISGGSIVLRDDLRSADPAAYRFDLAIGTSRTLADVLAPDVLFSGNAQVYAFGAVLYGTSGAADGSPISIEGMTAAAVAYGPADEENLCSIRLEDGNGQTLADLGGYQIYYLYYPMPVIRYMEETAGGLLTPVEGAQAGTITYSGAVLTLNGVTVVQDQKLEIPSDGITISQSADSFRMPPLLDKEDKELYLVYSKIGVGEPDKTNTDEISASEGLVLYIRIEDSRMQWRFDGSGEWVPFTAMPTIYAIYRERGYSLTITKHIPIDTGYKEPFTITVTSSAITRSHYAVEGTGSSTIQATPAAGSEPGVITFEVVADTSVKLIGLGAGTYTITETRNDNYTLTASIKAGSEAAAEAEVSETSSLTLDLNAETDVDLTNTPIAICQVGTRQFYSIKSAVEYIDANSADLSGTIEMLVDYVMPSSDAPEIPDYLTVTLTSAEGVKTITRKDTFTSGPMLMNSGSLTLENVTLDGAGVSVSSAMIQNEGELTIGEGAVLTGANARTDGGAVNSWAGSVTVSGGSLIGNTAASGGAIYASAGTVTIGDGTLSNNTAGNGGAVYYGGSETVTISGGSLSGNSAENGGAVYMNTGTLLVSGGSMTGNTASEDGGAICAANAVIEISAGSVGSAEAGNTARKGGAIYADAGAVLISGSAAVAGNTASERGGAVYTSSGSVTMSGGGVSGNTAQICGGAVYAASGSVSISGGRVNENSAMSGGGIYSVSGTVTLTGSTTRLTGNTAASGDGGAVYAASGTVTSNNLTLSGNTASGNGGAFWLGTGTASYSSCTMTGNSAANGAAIFANSANVTISNGSITTNTATQGGAVGIGSDSAKLTFSNNPKVTDNTNTTSGEACNVYLDQDSDTVINITKLSGSNPIGIYVAGDLTGDLFMHRGVPSARFATYTNNTASISKFQNDRLSGLSVQTDTSAKKLFWGKSFTLEVRYLASYADGFPPTAAGTLKQTYNSYFAPSGVNAISAIAADVRTAAGSNTAIFAHAFVSGASSFADYITDVNWDSAENAWKFVKRDGTSVTSDKLIVYFTEPAYISIENNTPYTLTIDPMEVLGQSVINSETLAGYGYIFAVNGAIQDELYPVTASDLTLAAGKSIKILLPGAAGAPYTLSGSFTDAAADIPYTQNGDPETLAQSDAGHFELSGTLLAAGNTYETIFGGSRAICRIVTADVGELAPDEIAGMTDVANDDGNYEYTFSTLNQAAAFISAHHLTEAAIEMLTDYLIPDSDVITSLPGGCDITFSTATDGAYKYSDDPSARATISRDQGNMKSFIVAETGNNIDTLTVKNLIFDGKNFAGSIDGGVVKTKDWNVVIDNVEFNNCIADNGGGIYIDFSPSGAGGTLTIQDSAFHSCISQSKKNRQGGGAIWTYAETLTLTNCTFDNCNSVDQGGAVFHRIDTETGNYENCTFAAATQSNFYNCSFSNCESRTGGAVESDAHHVVFSGCTFQNCYSVKNVNNKTGSGGAIGTYIYEDGSTSWGDKYHTTLDVTGCTFEHCTASVGTGTSGNGGAIRSHSLVTTITDSSFSDCRANTNGGAICVNNQKAKTSAYTAVISGCTIDDCSANGIGGGIYANALLLTVDGETTITNCWSNGSGGGVSHDRNANGTSLTLSSVSIENCWTNNGSGGGMSSMAQTVVISDTSVSSCQTMSSGSSSTDPRQGGGVYLDPSKVTNVCTVSVTDSTISDCSAIGSGGGLFYNKEAGTLVITDSTISHNTTDAAGGGVYTNAKAVTLEGTTLSGSTASGNGGGICHDRDSASDSLTLGAGTSITGNTSGGMGGGVYTFANLAMNSVSVTGNSLSTDTAADAAGIYMKDARTLTLGAADAELDTITVSGNKTASGAASDLRLPEDADSGENSNSVRVLCGLAGEILVVNANAKGTQFGESSIEYPRGFSDFNHVFVADDGTLFGIVDRQDEENKRIIWAGDPICKITDGSGRLLYLDQEHTYPAIFDFLDKDNSEEAARTSAFGILRYENPPLYNADGTPYTGNKYQVKMLIENHTIDSCINTAEIPEGRTIVLTTAGSGDSLYPYRGRSGTRAVIRRGEGAEGDSLLNAHVNLELTNIVLDGNSQEGRLIHADEAGITIKLGRNASLQNGSIPDGNGGGVLLSGGASLNIEGGTIRSCNAQDGGGVYKEGDSGSVTLSGGSITRCTAAGTGGGVSIAEGPFTMSGGSITYCTAAVGGGVYVPNDTASAFTMSSGSISSNTASVKGGGIAVEGSNSRLFFSGAAYVSGNTMNGEACNVYMDQTFDLDENEPGTIINSSGLIRGASIGVYVPDNDDLYEKHGDINDPFGTYWGSTDGLNYFTNDRNGLKGGLLEDQASENHKIYWRQIYTLLVTKRVISDDPADMDKEFSFTVTLSGHVDGVAEPENFSGLYGNMGFINGTANFTLKSGQSMEADRLPFGFTYTITENLEADEQEYYNTMPGLTQVVAMNENEMKYTYPVTFNNIHAICKITDRENGLLYYKVGDEYYPAVYSKLVNAFNGLNSAQYSTSPYYYYLDGNDYQPAAVNNEDTRIEMLIPDYTLENAEIFHSGTMALLTTASPDADDGFPYIGTGTAVIRRGYDGASMITVQGDLGLGSITLDGGSGTYSGTSDGGVLQVESDASLTVGTGATIRNSYTSGDGAGVYLAEGAAMYISGKPSFSGNTVDASAITDQTNGGQSVYANGIAQQDIYIAGYSGTTAASLVVTGDITASAGSIWVWAEQDPHPGMGQQFARMQGGTHSGLNAFRNARTDADTDNLTGGYLYGVSHDGDTENVYWNGAILTVTKTIDGSFADFTQRFDFTVGGLTSGQSYKYQRYTSTDGSTWTADADDPSGTLTASSDGRITFELGHHERLDIILSAVDSVTVAEENGYYTAAYVIDDGESEEGNSADVTMNGNTTCAFTNTLESPSPTGVQLVKKPYIWMLLSGLALLTGTALLSFRWRRKERVLED